MKREYIYFWAVVLLFILLNSRIVFLSEDKVNKVYLNAYIEGFLDGRK